MIVDPKRFIRNRLAELGLMMRETKAGHWQAQCPAHEDRNPSLSISAGCDGRVLLKCHAGCATEAVVDALGMTMANLMPEGGRGKDRPAGKPAAKKRKARKYPTAAAAIESIASALGCECTDVWTYHRADGAEAMRVLRYDPPGGKQFRPIHPVDGGWAIGDPPGAGAIPGALPLYRLPELAAAGQVFVCEGEKAADAARSIGLIATTSAHGCKSAHRTDWRPLAGKRCVILPDHDEPGERYAADVVKYLRSMDAAADARIVRLPGLPDGGDMVEWLEARDAIEPDALRAEIEAMAEAAEVCGEESGVRSLQSFCMADVEAKPLAWLWYPFLPLGKLVVIAGDPGLGKSVVTLDLAARVSCGRGWPNDPDARQDAGEVILLSAEDDAADTIRPRLEAAGADLRKVHLIPSLQDGRSLNLQRDLQRLAVTLAKRPNVRLIVIDPITAYLGATDSHKNADVRALLAPLGQMANEHRCTVLLVSHLNKSASGNAQYRISGSLAFTAAARATLVFSKDRDDPQQRIMATAKANLAPDLYGMAYRIENDPQTAQPVVRWIPELRQISADDTIASSEEQDDIAERDDATDWVRKMLADGPMAAAKMLADGQAIGFSAKVLRRALKRAGGDNRKSDFSGGWEWYLTIDRAEGAQDSLDAPCPDADTLGTFAETSIAGGAE